MSQAKGTGERGAASGKGGKQDTGAVDKKEEGCKTRGRPRKDMVGTDLRPFLTAKAPVQHSPVARKRLNTEDDGEIVSTEEIEKVNTETVQTVGVDSEDKGEKNGSEETTRASGNSGNKNENETKEEGKKEVSGVKEGNKDIMEKVENAISSMREEIEDRLTNRNKKLEEREKLFDKKLEILVGIADKIMESTQYERLEDNKWLGRCLSDIKMMIQSSARERVCQGCKMKEDEIVNVNKQAGNKRKELEAEIANLKNTVEVLEFKLRVNTDKVSMKTANGSGKESEEKGRSGKVIEKENEEKMGVQKEGNTESVNWTTANRNTSVWEVSRSETEQKRVDERIEREREWDRREKMLAEGNNWWTDEKKKTGRGIAKIDDKYYAAKKVGGKIVNKAVVRTAEVERSKPCPLNDTEFFQEMEIRKQREKNLDILYKQSRLARNRQEVKEVIERITGIRLNEAKMVKEQLEEKRLRIQVKTMEEKKNLMKMKGILKGTEIWIDDDSTRRQIEVRKWLREVAKEEEKKGKIVRMGNLKIMVDNVWLRWNEIKGDLKAFRRSSY